MPRPKSILQNASVDSAGRAHNCQHINSHRIEKGQKRLKVKVDRSFDHFCVTCALKIIDSDISTLQELRQQLTEGL